MALISLARAPKRGPIGALPRLIRDHPLAQGLVGFWVPGVSSQDLVSSLRATPFNSGGRRVFSKNGNPARRFTSANSEGLTPGTSSQYNPTTGLTAAALYTPTTSASNAILIARDDNALGRGFILSHNEGSAEKFVIFNSAGAATVNINTGSVATATERMIMGCFNNDVGGSALIRDGVALAGSGATAPFTFKSTTGATTIGYRTYSGSTFPFDGDLTIVALWNRSLYTRGSTSVEIRDYKDFSNDPWQLLTWKPATQVFILGSGVSSSVTGTIASTLADVTSSISGTVTPPAVTGTIAVTLADVTSSISGDASTDVTGTIAAVLDNVQPAISGSVANPPTESQLVLRSTLPVITSGAQLIVPAHQYAYARVTNLTGVTIYVGGADVTAANGFPIANNGSEQFELRMTDALYAVAASGSNNLNVLVQIH